VNVSPKLAIVFGIVENLFLLFSMIVIHPLAWDIVLIFIIINLFIKVIPLYTLRNERIDYCNSIISILSLFMIYILWILAFGKKIDIDILNIFNKKRIVSYDETPGTMLIIDIRNYILK
jgi:hypothetical protein